MPRWCAEDAMGKSPAWDEELPGSLSLGSCSLGGFSPVHYRPIPMPRNVQTGSSDSILEPALDTNIGERKKASRQNSSNTSRQGSYNSSRASNEGSRKPDPLLHRKPDPLLYGRSSSQAGIETRLVMMAMSSVARDLVNAEKQILAEAKLENAMRA